MDKLKMELPKTQNGKPLLRFEGLDSNSLWTTGKDGEIIALRSEYSSLALMLLENAPKVTQEMLNDAVGSKRWKILYAIKVIQEALEMEE